jgi:5-formyltetrahydrofolate cyclo-ligase
MVVTVSDAYEPVDPYAPETSAAVLSDLFGAASDSDLRPIIRTALKAGLMWTCPTCRQHLYLTADSCSVDRTPRPGGGAGE